VRLFIAIDLPSGEKQRIGAAIAPMRAAAQAITWVPDERLHLTMKFLGEQAEERMSAVEEALSTVAARHRQMELVLGGLGAFPNLRQPRVVWMGVARDPRLELLHHDIEEACAALGHQVDGRAFRPHITLARVRERLPVPAARALATAARSVSYGASIMADTVDLMVSEPGASGPRYRLLAAAALKEG